MKKTYLQPTTRTFAVCTAEMLAASNKDGIVIGGQGGNTDPEVEEQGTRHKSIWETDDWKNAVNK